LFNFDERIIFILSDKLKSYLLTETLYNLLTETLYKWSQPPPR